MRAYISMAVLYVYIICQFSCFSRAMKHAIFSILFDLQWCFHMFYSLLWLVHRLNPTSSRLKIIRGSPPHIVLLVTRSCTPCNRSAGQLDEGQFGSVMYRWRTEEASCVPFYCNVLIVFEHYSPYLLRFGTHAPAIQGLYCPSVR